MFYKFHVREADQFCGPKFHRHRMKYTAAAQNTLANAEGVICMITSSRHPGQSPARKQYWAHICRICCTIRGKYWTQYWACYDNIPPIFLATIGPSNI